MITLWRAGPKPRTPPLGSMRFARGVDGYSFPAFDFLRRSWNCHGQHSIFKRSTDSVRIDIPIKRQLALKAPVKSLTEGSILRLAFQFFLSANGQQPLLKENFDFVLLHAGQVGGHAIALSRCRLTIGVSDSESIAEFFQDPRGS